MYYRELLLIEVIFYHANQMMSRLSPVVLVTTYLQSGWNDGPGTTEPLLSSFFSLKPMHSYFPQAPHRSCFLPGLSRLCSQRDV